MEHFLSVLSSLQAGREMRGRRWYVVAYDQLSAEMGEWSRERVSEVGIILMESLWKAGRRPYHKQKLALILSNQRSFALEQAARGIAIRYLVGRGSYRKILEMALMKDEILSELTEPLRMMEPAERELRVDLTPLVEQGKLGILRHEGWLSDPEDFTASRDKEGRWRMDAFYRHLRQKTGILMERGKPLGGKYSFDTENRRAWKGDPPAPEMPRFPEDPVKSEVGAFIDEHLGHHPGRLDLLHLPATQADAEALWAWAMQSCLPLFGPYEDAMSLSSRGLFHTRLSALMNLHRLLPRRIVEDTLRCALPLASKEGFLRQILGWREFVRHVHRETDGFHRDPKGEEVAVSSAPGDGGYARWAMRDWARQTQEEEADGGALPNFLEESLPLPPAFWGRPSGLHCLDTVVTSVWEEGYSHHITRLMVLSNLAALLGVTPREITDWFWVAYTDAYDWVVEPNVLGMGVFAIGDQMTTKPYISGTPYLHKMSDYCGSCRFDPKVDCPISSLYWSYLARHEKKLAGNPRLNMPLASLRKRAPALRAHDQAILAWARQTLLHGEALEPSTRPR